jgi:hypothetical protein
VTSVCTNKPAAWRAVTIDRACQLGWQQLAEAHFFARDYTAFHDAAERAMALIKRISQQLSGLERFVNLAMVASEYATIPPDSLAECRSEELQIFSLPAHCSIDAAAAARKDSLLNSCPRWG